MYAVVEYKDYRKEQNFQVIITTDDVEYARKLAFQNAKKSIAKYRDNYIYKITTKIEDEYLRPINKTIISFRIISVTKYNDGFKIVNYYSRVYAVIELDKINDENVEEIETSLICDDYYNNY